MSAQNQTQKNDKLQVVYVVKCYQNVVGVYADPHDAFAVQMDSVNKNRPASMEPWSVVYPKVM